MARVLGKEDEARVVWDEYNRRVLEIKAVLGDRVQDVEVSFAYACCGGISIDTENSFSGSIRADIGIRRPKRQAAVADGLVILSEERIPDIDAEVIFFSVYNNKESAEILVNLHQKPL